MFVLEYKDYDKALPLIKSDNNLSVVSVLNGRMGGKVFVDSKENPTATIVKTSECTLVAGSTSNSEFNNEIKEICDFWEPLTPDTSDWKEIITKVHANKYVREYTRKYYKLLKNDFVKEEISIPDNLHVAEVDIETIRSKRYINSEHIIDAIDDWQSDDKFRKYGGGLYLCNGEEILSYSPLDCSFLDRVEIGIHTMGGYRKQGLGIKTAYCHIESCFNKGYKEIGWHCTEFNKGSIALAEKLGFSLESEYITFTPYPPIENVRDLSEKEWEDWAVYYENAAIEEPRLWSECLVAYIRSNNVSKADEVLAKHQEYITNNFNDYIKYLQKIGVATNFTDNWMKV